MYLYFFVNCQTFAICLMYIFYIVFYIKFEQVFFVKFMVKVMLAKTVAMRENYCFIVNTFKFKLQ